MKYLIVAIATLFAAGSALAQTTAPAEPASKPATKEAAPAKPATAKDVGTKGAAIQAEADRAAKRRAAMAKKKASQSGKADAKPGGKSGTKSDPEKLPGPGSLMTADERTAYRTKLKSFKTFDECESFRKTHDAEMVARAKAQGNAVRESTGSGCERFKATAGKVPDKAAPK